MLDHLYRLNGAYCYFADDNDLPRIGATPKQYLDNLDRMESAIRHERTKLAHLVPVETDATGWAEAAFAPASMATIQTGVYVPATAAWRLNG